MGGLAMIGAIAFDPTVRGILVVVVGTVVLMGSIFMILATNSGVRVGFLVATSGFFAWMFLMGAIWVIYGIGLKGRDPAWMPTDINYTRAVDVPGSPELAKLPAEEALPIPRSCSSHGRSCGPWPARLAASWLIPSIKSPSPTMA